MIFAVLYQPGSHDSMTHRVFFCCVFWKHHRWGSPPGWLILGWGYVGHVILKEQIMVVSIFTSQDRIPYFLINQVLSDWMELQHSDVRCLLMETWNGYMIHVNIIVYTTWKVENAQLPLVLVYPGPLRTKATFWELPHLLWLWCTCTLRYPESMEGSDEYKDLMWLWQGTSLSAQSFLCSSASPSSTPELLSQNLA